MLADGTVFWGRGFGAHTAETAPVGEVCFNTGMTGYQETLTDPSYAGQIITFTFPHIGNVGTNGEDIEAATIAARGLVVKQDVTEPSNWRAAQHLDAWLRAQGIAGIAGVDTRALTVRIRDGGAPNGVLAFPRMAASTSPRCARGPRPGRGWRAWTSPGRSPAANPTSGTRPAGLGPTAPGVRPRRSTTSWRWTTERSATSFAASHPPAAG